MRRCLVVGDMLVVKGVILGIVGLALFRGRGLAHVGRGFMKEWLVMLPRHYAVPLVIRCLVVASIDARRGAIEGPALRLAELLSLSYAAVEA